MMPPRRWYAKTSAKLWATYLSASLSQVVAIDATWSAAKNMVKRLPPHYRRVFIAADSVADDGTAAMPMQSLLRPVRKYRGADGRMCTLEAIVGLLRCVGESAHRCSHHPSPPADFKERVQCVVSGVGCGRASMQVC
jgi:DTW domain-containing protein YfiP